MKMKNKNAVVIFLKSIGTILSIIAFALFATPFAETSFAGVSGFDLAFDFEGNISKSFFWSLLSLALTAGMAIGSLISLLFVTLVISKNQKAVQYFEKTYRNKTPD